MVKLYSSFCAFRKTIILSIVLLSTISSGMAQTFPVGTDVTVTSSITYSGVYIWGGSLTIKSGAIVTFTGALGLGGTSKVIIEPGAKLIIVTGGLAMQATTSLVSQGSIAVRAGGFNIQENATFTLSGINKDTIIGGAIFNGTSNINIGANTDLYIDGNITGQSPKVKVDGSISVNGTIFIGGSPAAVFTGEGDITTTGSMKNTQNSDGSMFGKNPFNCSTGPCSGKNFCTYTNTITSSITVSACGGATVTITANTPSGTPTYQWQRTTTLGGAWSAAAGTNTTSNYTVSGLATTTYFRRYINIAGCISYSKVVTVLATEPAVPFGIGDVFCSGTKVSLTALGSPGLYQWYTSASGSTAITGEIKENFTTPVLTATTSYYVSAIVGGCESTTRQEVIATLLTPPTVTSAYRCGGGTVMLTASGMGGSYQWYNSSKSKISGATNATYTTNWIGSTTTYYVSLIKGSFETVLVPVTATIVANNFTAPIITSNSPACVGSTLNLSTSTIAGATYSWTGPNGYTATGQNVSRTNLTAAMAGSYKVKTTIGSCVSAEGTSTVAVNLPPTINSVTPGSRCGAGSVGLGAAASSGTVNWYIAATGGAAVATGASYATPSISETTTYYVDASNGASCITASRTAVVATVSETPSIIEIHYIFGCGIPSVVEMTAQSSDGIGTVNWYTTTTGGTPVATGINYSPSLSASTYFYVDATTNGCTTPTRSEVTATVKVMPKITSSTPGSRCGTGPVTLKATSDLETIRWYASPTGGSTIVTGGVFTPTVTSTTTYYVSAVLGGCGSTPRTAVVATVNDSCMYTWLGSSNSDWSISSNWDQGYIPTNKNNVIIPATVVSGNMPIISTIAPVATLTNNGSITLAGSGIFNVYGDINSTGTWTSATGSTLNLVGSAAQSITGVSAVSNITINNSAGISITNAMTVNGAVTLKAGVLTTNNKVTINFDNGGNIAYNPSDAGSVVGSLTGTRNLTYKTHYIAAPFDGVTSAQVQATTPLFVGKYWKMYTKDFVKQNWSAVTTTTQSMPLGTGFSLSLPTAAPLNLSGTYTHGSTFNSEAYSNVGVEKYFMIGNPYPSTLDWDNGAGWTKTNIGGSIYYLNAATSQTASYVGGTATNGGTGYVPAMQSFMVLCTGTGGYSSVSINNNARISLQNPSFWRVASEDIIRIHLTGENPVLTDEAVIRFNESATNMFDFDLDATKIMNGGKYPSVYTREGSSQYSINSYARPDSAKVIPVLAKLVEDGTYTLRFENTNSSIQYVLIDNQLGVEQPITEPYTFVGTNKDSVNRFELQLRENAVTNPAIPTGLQSSNNTRGMQIYSSVKGFILQSDRYVGEAVDIELMDITGNKVKSISNQSITSNRTFVAVDLADGSYLVRVHLGSEVFIGLIVLVQ